MKRIYPVMLSALLASLMAACGGGGGGTENGNPGGGIGGGGNPPVTRLAASPQIVEYYGDSTIRGYVSGSGGAQASPDAVDVFASTIASSGQAAGHTVRNLGVDGETACNLLNGDNGRPDWNTVLSASDATVVILNHGINDGFATDASNRVSIPQYQSCLTSLAQTAKARGKRIIFETPNPIADDGLAAYAQAMRDVAAQQGLSLIDQYAHLVALRGTNDNTTIAPDGFHPSNEIYQEKGRFAAGVYLNLGS